MRNRILYLVVCAGSLARIDAAAIAVFDNSSYVNSSGGASAASDSIQALLTLLGHTVTPFTGTSAGDFAAAASTSDLILFPDLLNAGQLALDLTPAAKAALSNYVNSGGGLIAVGENAHRLLNVVFYPGCNFVTVHCFASSGTGSPSYLQPSGAAGTPFASGPATLSSPPQPTTALNLVAFSPPGVLNLYRDSVGGFPNSTTVLMAPFGTGSYGYLAWDFAQAVPLGSLDGGWSNVLNTMVVEVAGVPEPSSMMLLGSGLAGLLCSRFRRSRNV